MHLLFLNGLIDKECGPERRLLCNLDIRYQGEGLGQMKHEDEPASLRRHE